jgi:hypothetical protein
MKKESPDEIKNNISKIVSQLFEAKISQDNTYLDPLFIKLLLFELENIKNSQSRINILATDFNTDSEFITMIIDQVKEIQIQLLGINPEHT